LIGIDVEEEQRNSTNRSGSLDVFTNHKLYSFNTLNNVSFTGDFEIIFKSSDKGFYYVRLLNDSIGFADYNFTDNVSALGNKYDLEYMHISGISIFVKVSDFAKLQKLKYVYFFTHKVTGSKEDLWNGGANIESYYTW